MTGWKEEEQKYKLIKRRPDVRVHFETGKSEDFTFVQASYLALKHHKDIQAIFRRDAHTDQMTFRKQKLEAHHPGRLQGLCDMPGIKLLGEIHPNDIRQGKVGDCWLLSAISALSEFPGAVSKLFNKTGNMLQLRDLPADEPRMYTVTLYDPKTLDPVDTEVDERLCVQTDGSLLGARPGLNGSLWPCYVEKAVAILCGGWDEIVGGDCCKGWRMLTGCNDLYEFRGMSKMWRCLRSTVSQTMVESDWPDVGGGGSAGSRCNEAEMFERMCVWDAEDFIMGAATEGSSDRNLKDGIVDNHGYTVISCLQRVAGTEHDLIKIRNPWGKTEFTKGVWRDGGPGWRQNPKVFETCKPDTANDGVFWMSRDEFFQYFKTFYLCAKSMTDFKQVAREAQTAM
ncbi:DEK1 [Symbiodinium pilosum]|uniref:DEK1 protein n=1 Tax=Symbiodinium pilosum TaxID=2952 RepID=A0A812WBL8_SYMPI|nr:DEK1 [Symbiodinium pilosum]